MANEPSIVVNGVPLTTSQAMAVRVAVTIYHMETRYNREDIGEQLADAYNARLYEVLLLMIGGIDEKDKV